MSADTHWQESPHHPVLGANAVHVWRASLRLSHPILGRLERTLSRDERARAEQYRFPEHRDAFVAGRGILRNILARYAQNSPAAIGFRYGSRGKPSLAAPWDRSGIRFNVSNSGELAVYAFTLGSEIGVDVEELRPIPDRAIIAEQFFSARENETLRTLRPDMADRAFFQCWTLKEAYIKATGDGLSLPLDGFEVGFAPDEYPRLLRTSDAEEAHRWRLQSLDPGRGYLAALAVHFSCSALKLYHWRSDSGRECFAEVCNPCRYWLPGAPDS